MRTRGPSFLKGVSVVASGTAAAQLIQVAISPVITRLYEPIHLGGAGAALALVGALLPWATLGFSSSIVVVNSQREALLAYGVSRRITVFFAVLLAIVSIVLASSSFQVSDDVGGLALLLVPPIIFISATRETRNFFLSRLKLFGLISRLSVAQAAVYSGMRVLGGLLFPSISVLLISYFIALVVQSGLSLRVLRDSLGHDVLKSARSSGRDAATAMAFVREKKDYALFRAPQSFMNAMAHGMPVLFVSSFVGLSEGGFVALAKTITSAPVMLVGQAVSIVALSHFSSRINDGGNIYLDQIKTTLALAGAGLVPVLLLSFLGPTLFAFVFGEPWRSAGEVAAVLSPLLFFQIVSRPAVSAIQPLGLIRWHFKFEVLSTCGKAVALYLGYIYDGYITAILAFSVASSFAYLITMFVTLRASKMRLLAPHKSSQ